MGCFGKCKDAGPPPNSILDLPPPPIPSFLQEHPLAEILFNTTPCSSSQLCDSLIASNRVPDSAARDYMELPRKDVETWTVSALDDTWLLVLVASSIGVLLLGALLAMFLLKCREMHLFDTGDCSSRHLPHTKPHPVSNAKLIHPSETHLTYNPQYPHADNRTVWAAITPHGGTRHFVSSEAYPRHLYNPYECPADMAEENHYETVDQVVMTKGPQPHHGHYVMTMKAVGLRQRQCFDNCGFVDYGEYEDPETYQLKEMIEETVPTMGNADMRCLGSLKRGVVPLLRPRVSSPTRIEHPNLPPLNMHPPTRNGTLKKGINGYSGGTLPKYAC